MSHVPYPIFYLYRVSFHLRESIIFSNNKTIMITDNDIVFIFQLELSAKG